MTNDEGFMTKAVKSDIVHVVESYLKEDDPKKPALADSFQTCYIVDVMANIRKLQEKKCKNFQDFCNAFLGLVTASTKAAIRIDLVFDSYMEKLLKDSEHQRRERKSPMELHEVSGENPLPMDRFWPSSANKVKLESLIHKEALERKWTSPSVEIIVSHFCGPGDSIPCSSKKLEVTLQVPELEVSLEEAYMQCIPHMMHAVNQGNKRIVFLSTDTDVFILLVYCWRELKTEGLEVLLMKAEVGNSTRFIPIHMLSLRIGPGLCKVLPSIHTLTGCDYTSKVGTKLAALTANPETYLGEFDSMING